MDKKEAKSLIHAVDIKFKVKGYEDSSKYFYLVGFLNWYNLSFIRCGSYINAMYLACQRAMLHYEKGQDIFFSRYWKEFCELQYKQFCEFKEMIEDGKIRK